MRKTRIISYKFSIPNVISYFAVLKESLEAKGDAVYANYRTSCINDLYSDASHLEIENYIETLTVEEKGIDRIINKMR